MTVSNSGISSRVQLSSVPSDIRHSPGQLRDLSSPIRELNTYNFGVERIYDTDDNDAFGGSDTDSYCSALSTEPIFMEFQRNRAARLAAAPEEAKADLARRRLQTLTNRPQCGWTLVRAWANMLFSEGPMPFQKLASRTSWVPAEYKSSASIRHMARLLQL